MKTKTLALDAEIANSHSDVNVPPSLGDIVIYHSGHTRKVDYPAIIQELFPDGTARLWILAVMSIYNEIALEGDIPGRWSRRRP